MTFIELTKKATTEKLITMRDKEWGLIDITPDCPEMAEYIDAAFRRFIWISEELATR